MPPRVSRDSDVGYSRATLSRLDCRVLVARLSGSVSWKVRWSFYGGSLRRQAAVGLFGENKMSENTQQMERQISRGVICKFTSLEEFSMLYQHVLLQTAVTAWIADRRILKERACN